MIYHEVAVEPTAIEDLKDLGLLERMFGFEHGRIISFVPAKPKDRGCWFSMLHAHLKTMVPPTEHKKLEFRLLELLDRVCFRSRNHSRTLEGQTWCDLALQQHKESPFEAILCRGAPPDSAMLPFQGLHAPDDSFPRFLRKPIHFTDAMKDPELFTAELRPLILSAKRLSLIDPYFNPCHPEKRKRRRWQSTVRNIAGFLRESGRLTMDVDFHTKLEGDQDAMAFVHSISGEIEGWFPPETRLRVVAWTEKYQGLSFHARYLITDKAGVALDYGTDTSPTRRTDVGLLPLHKVEQRLREFDPETPSVYIHEATHALHGSRGL